MFPRERYGILADGTVTSKAEGTVRAFSEVRLRVVDSLQADSNAVEIERLACR